MSREVHVRFCESRGVRLPPATHLVILCRTRQRAEEACRQAAEILATLGLHLHPDKTRIVELTKGRQGFDFLAATRGRTVRVSTLIGGPTMTAA